jgi:hypothetical protein
MTLLAITTNEATNKADWADVGWTIYKKLKEASDKNVFL